MAHQCVHCKAMYPAGSRVLLDGCEKCKSRFFFYIRDELAEKIKQGELELNPIEVPQHERKKIESDIREIVGIADIDIPVVLDIESVRAVGQGKFEIDLTNLFDKKKPIIFKLEEGKYMIDLATTLQKGKENKEDQEEGD